MSSLIGDTAGRTRGESTDGADSARRVVPLLAGLISVVALTVVGSWWMPVSWFLVASLTPLSVAAWIDRHERRLPDRLLLVATIPILVAVAGWIVSGHLDAATSVVLGAAYMGAPLLALHLVSPASLGFGDVKAGGVLGAGLGLIDPALALIALCVAAGAAATWGIGRSQREVPMGPAFVLGALSVVIGARVAGIGAPPWP